MSVLDRLEAAVLRPDRTAATSGDSDSIACLAGAFLGTAHGRSAWPEEWATQIEYAGQLRSLSHSLTG